MELREARAGYWVEAEQRVPKGYKQTEVGVIPDDWDTPELGDILNSMQLGGNYKNSERETSWPLIKMGNLGRGSIKLDKCEFIDSSQPPSSRDRLEKDDVLFNTRNTLDLVGKVAAWRNELAEAYFNSNIMRMKFEDGRVSSNPFMNYILNTQQFLKSLRGIAIGTTSVAAIYSRDLVKLKIPLPTKAEQEAIAEALSDTDVLIESLEQLVTKKRQIKQGTMQELLTGKKRLPGFGGEWEEKKMKQFGEIVTGGTPPTGIKENWNGDIPWITPTDISDKKDIHRSERLITTLGLASIRRLPSNSVLITCIASIGKNAVLRNEGACNQQINAIIPNKEHDADFLYYLIESNKQYLLGNAGITATMIISKRDFSELDFTVPLRAEQTAIATILSDMDAEIATLEEKLAKTRAIKQGMMHNLLTGRIRLL